MAAEPALHLASLDTHPRAADISPVQTFHNAAELAGSQKRGTQGSSLAIHVEGSESSDAAVLVRSRLRMGAVLAGLYLSLFVAALDQTIVSTAIPTISSDFKSASGYTWIGGAYLLANAAAGPIWAKLSDIWGRKPLLLCALAGFAASSVVCAVSSSMQMLIIGRSFQGACAGGLIQLVHITISDIFSMRSRTLYLGMLEAMWAIAGGAGPLLGGTFTQLVSWRWIFWINLPFSALTWLLLFFFLDVHNPRTRVSEGLRAIDWLGSLSILGLTVMVLLGLNFGGTVFPWNSAKVICLTVFGALMSICFIYSEKRLAKYPLMPLYLFAKPSSIAGFLVGFLHGFVFIAAEYYLPLYFQSVLAASPLRSGVLILPVCVMEALVGVAVGVIIHRTGRYRELIWIGTAFLTIGNGLFVHLDARSSIAEIVILQLIAGFGAGLLFEPPLIALQALVSQDDTAITTATFGFMRNLATAVSIVVGGVVFQNSMAKQSGHLRAAGLATDAVTNFSGREAAAHVESIAKIADPAQRLAVKEAFAWSLRNVWILMTCVSFLSIVASLFIIRRTLSREHRETRTGIEKTQPSPPVVAA